MNKTNSQSNYPGNKNIPGLIHKIVNQIPVCTNFYEPFAGSGSVSNFLSLLPMVNLNYFINDIDPSVTDKYNYPAGSVITNHNAFHFLEKIPLATAPKDTFIFLDPPYLESTRNSQKQLYSTSLTPRDHFVLLSTLGALKYNCMIIHPSCPLYNDSLKSWRTIKVSVRYHNKTSIEKLYMNYPQPQQLLTYALYGNNCWDRQRIKRKADRLIKKLSALPAAERNYILNKLKQSFK